MSLDVLAWLRVACAVGLAAGCGPVVPAVQPPAEPGVEPPPPRVEGAPRAAAATPSRGEAVRPGRRIVVGEMCPQGAAGRPGIAPLLLRGVQWTDDPGEVGDAISHGDAVRFSVFAVDGERAGTFEVLGLAEVGLPQVVAAGSYVGSGPCTRAGGNGARLEEPSCQTATKGCGVAVASLGDRPAPMQWKTGGACVAGDALMVDIDGDGAAEAFPVSGLLDGVRAPADALEASAVAASCTPTFSRFGLRIAPPTEPGKAADPRYLVLIDVLAVVDLDDDGRRELVLGLRYPDSRSVVVYSADGAAGALRRIGEAASWRP
jgi:hypothetical protein